MAESRFESRLSTSSPTSWRSPRPQAPGGAARVSRLWALVLLAVVLLVAFVARHRYRTAGARGTPSSSVWVRTAAGPARVVVPHAAAAAGRPVRGGSSGRRAGGTDADVARASPPQTGEEGEGEGEGPGLVSRLLTTLLGGGSSSSSSSQVQQPSSAAAADTRSPRQRLVDSEPVHVAYTACGYPTEAENDMFGLVSLKSLLMVRAMGGAGDGGNGGDPTTASARRRRRYVVHIMTSMSDADLFNTTALNWEVARALQAERETVEVRVYRLADLDAAGAELGFRDMDAVPHTVFKTCAASRLKLPFVLRRAGVERVLYLDWDTVVTCDLTRLWSMFGSWEAEKWVGFALNDPTGLSQKDIYRLHDVKRHPKGAVSSGVMMMDVGRMGADKDKVLRMYWDEVVAIVRKAVPDQAGEKGSPDFWVLTKAFPLGDQDILNAILADHPEVLFLIPPEYNWCLADLVPFAELKRAGFHRPLPCVHHFCGQRLFSDMMRHNVGEGEEGSPDDRGVKALYQYYRTTPIVPPEPPPGPWMPPGEEGAR
jgi:hypothetical protein